MTCSNAFFVNENYYILIPLKFIPDIKGPADKISELVQVMAWHCSGANSLHEPVITLSIDAYMQSPGPIFYLISWVKSLGKSLAIVFDPK